MDSSLTQHLKSLRAALLAQPATGEKGFEGLIAAMLREICGVPFRLASSGSQFGVDGKSAYEGDGICFEGKRYDGSVPRSEVISKVAELSLKGGATDIWVLGSTSSISSQLSDDLRELGGKDGITVLILDWSETQMPPLAVALAMGDQRVRSFLEVNIGDPKVLQEALDALGEIRSAHDFGSHAERIREKLNEPTVGASLARRANVAWLFDTFSDRMRAKKRFGQPLCPAGVSASAVRPRKELLDKLKPCLTSDNGQVVCILGGEGNGKSWVVAQSWLALDSKPLMIVMNPDDIIEVGKQSDITDALVVSLLKQTGDDVTEAKKLRWHRRLAQWRNSKSSGMPRLVVVIDGINQRPGLDWARIIDHMSGELVALSGRLIITSRTQYFRDRIKRRLGVSVHEIVIPEWSDDERDAILSAYDIKASDLHPAVARSLRNPRLLGIALELLSKTEIANLEELSVSRLLFEHMRTSERDALEPQPAFEFARRLCEHAQKILERYKAKRHDDLDIFMADLPAVADGRFYHEVVNDPTRYSLKSDGLTLALGFAVIDRLRVALRNDRDLEPELDAILEPIAALDDAANVVLAALTVATVDTDHEQDLVAALVKGFVALQNPDSVHFTAFAGLARKRPLAFMTSARALALADGNQPNFDWLQKALIVASRNSLVWQEMQGEVHSWLSLYSLSPERGTFVHTSQGEEKKNQELEKKRSKIAEALNNLSVFEKDILDCSCNDDGDIDRLSRLAFYLLAGKPLVSFSKTLLSWSFSNALNGDYSSPHKEFNHLLQLNCVDWADTRAALTEVIDPLRGSVSRTGKWTLVAVLRGTGDNDDAVEAETVAKELTKDRLDFEDWRQVERYCATDPCDPDSCRPENITTTAGLYEAIDVSKLRLQMGVTQEDLLFATARAGLARFAPDVAIEKHKEFARDVLSRTGFPLRQGLLELRDHGALLSPAIANQLVRKRRLAATKMIADGMTSKDTWIVSQYMLLLAFPFLNGEEQITTMLSDQSDENILLDLMDLAKPIDQKKFEELLALVCEEKSERKQYLLLEFARGTVDLLSTAAVAHISDLLHSESERVRAHAMGFIAENKEESLLREVAASDWSAATAKTENGYEVWYGSAVLLEAAARALMSHEDAVDRILPSLYGRAATMLAAPAIRNIAKRIDISIHRALAIPNDLIGPEIELQVRSVLSCEPNLFKVGDPPAKSMDPAEEMKRMFSESSVEFEKRQTRNHEAFDEFTKALKSVGAGIVLDHLDLAEFDALLITEGNEEYAARWHSLFMQVADSGLPAIHNVALLLAHSLGAVHPLKSQQLFLRLRASKPTVQIVYFKSRVELDLMATWSGKRNKILDQLRVERLDRAATDHDLSLEVLAASLNGQQELLNSYVEAKLGRQEPAEVARCLMVVGYSDRSDFNDHVLARFAGQAGLVGVAQKAAKYAYERNAWAQHWFERMCESDSVNDFWRYGVLFLKVVDGRYDLWRSNNPGMGEPARTFGQNVECQIRSRIDHWKSAREKHLFGLDAPAAIFLDRNAA